MTIPKALSKNPILHDFKLFWDKYYGGREEAVDQMLNICDLLHTLSGSTVPAPDELNPRRCYGDLIPGHWGFSAGWSATVEDLRERIANDQDETGGLAEWYFNGGITIEDLIYSGNVLNRWIDFYDRVHGKD